MSIAVDGSSMRVAPFGQLPILTHWGTPQIEKMKEWLRVYALSASETMRAACDWGETHTQRPIASATWGGRQSAVACRSDDPRCFSGVGERAGTGSRAQFRNTDSDAE